MTIQRLEPPAALRTWVEFVSQRRTLVNSTPFPVFPMMRTELWFNAGDPISTDDDPQALKVLPPFAVLGARSSRYWQKAGPVIDWFLIALTPRGCRRYCRSTAADLAFRDQDLMSLAPDLAGEIQKVLCSRLQFEERFDDICSLLAAFGSSGAELVTADDAVERAADIARTRPIASVGEFAKMTGLSERQFRSRFRQSIGLSPKPFLSIMRFNRFIAALHPRPWLRFGEGPDIEFYDQSHAIREFSRFTGMTPGEYVRLKEQISDRLIFTGS